MSRPSWRARSSAKRDRMASGSSASCTTIWDISTWSREPCRPSTIRSARDCHLCLGTVCYPCLRVGQLQGLADGVGFEPTRRSPARRFSRPVPSTARPPIPRHRIKPGGKTGARRSGRQTGPWGKGTEPRRSAAARKTGNRAPPRRSANRPRPRSVTIRDLFTLPAGMWPPNGHAVSRGGGRDTSCRKRGGDRRGSTGRNCVRTSTPSCSDRRSVRGEVERRARRRRSPAPAARRRQLG